MKSTILTKIVLITLCSGLVYAHKGSDPQTINAVYKNDDVSLRFHAQWVVDERTQKRLHDTYGVMRIRFDKNGRPIPHGLSPAQVKRWERLYKLCMSDGCYYCDASEGSCELGTCGMNNEHCKPHIAYDGQPICGNVCADYAFTSILICNDLS